MRVQSIFCDVCKVQKGDTNHWWSIRIDGEGFTVKQVENGGWGFDICGAECVQKKLSEFMGGQ